ncbi:melatonin receptor type 1A-like [Acanthaster planci]|uniref:Melatonin receptor type 1A-like n=1 Tax=Acanthaster planci TaxID=133434 RepID=A0A8B7XTT1_ACAPL|nr:melatonin receptor type 1A-like [Acanthaster planci]XP_022083639.1 melatonin receptor type 1A-like [Acanthaster planci]XP_022083640.1 melatonin receptor type 1A-like [Acanthaster planci]
MEAVTSQPTVSDDFTTPSSAPFTGLDEQVTPDEHLPEQRAAFRAVLVAFFVVSMAWGNIGNPLVMATILTQRKLRQNVANVFIFNLAIADFCVTSFVDLSYVLGNVIPDLLIKNRVFCGFAAAVCIISCTCSLWSITAISINRYVCVAKSALYPRVYTRRNTLLMAAAVWLICFLIDLPNLVGLGAHVFDAKKRGCSFDRLDHYGYTLYFIGMGVVTPMTIVIICYIKTFLFVREHNMKIQTWQTDVGSGDGQAVAPGPAKKPIDTRLLKTVVVIFLVFLACWTPYTIIVLSDLRNTYPDELYVAAIIFAHANSSMNSIVYGIMNRSFRQGYKNLIRVLTRGCLCNTEHHGSGTDNQTSNHRVTAGAQGSRR